MTLGNPPDGDRQDHGGHIYDRHGPTGGDSESDEQHATQHDRNRGDDGLCRERHAFSREWPKETPFRPNPPG
jgi:hypothetical protein